MVISGVDSSVGSFTYIASYILDQLTGRSDRDSGLLGSVSMTMMNNSWPS
jgi:hypothetical protein